MSNRHEDARIGEQKIFHETDVHHVYKVGMSLKPSVFFHVLRSFCARNESNSHQLARI